MAFCEYSDAFDPRDTPTPVKNTDPAKIDATNIGDAVVLRLPCGTEQSAIVRHVAPDGRVDFVWKTGPKPGDVAGFAAGGPFLAKHVIAIFPPGAMFLVK